MKDIDFDELDKAVSSLMNQNDQTAPVATETSSNEQPESAVSEPVAVTVVAREDTTPSSAPAKKRSGRFMDMVHPSADMAKRTTLTPISREGTTIAPVNETVVSDETIAETTNPSVADPQISNLDTPPDSSTMPDPLDTHQDAAENEVVDSGTNENEVSEPEKDDDLAQSMESPFLPDAKIEKRPLGGESTDELMTDESSQVSAELTESELSVEKEPENDEPPLQPAPAELGEAVVAVEATEPKEESVDSSDENIPDQSAVIDQPVAPTNGAINQQYKEQPSSGDTRHAAIYDAETYPTTAKPPKKKSGWLWVLWIFILLSLGAGGALALYMMNII